jgi:hypothetical protein
MQIVKPSGEVSRSAVGKVEAIRAREPMPRDVSGDVVPIVADRDTPTGLDAVVPLDAPRNIKLAQLLRLEGQVAVAFPEEVRVYLPDPEKQGIVTHKLTSYVNALEVIAGSRLSTRSLTL